MFERWSSVQNNDALRIIRPWNHMHWDLAQRSLGQVDPTTIFHLIDFTGTMEIVVWLQFENRGYGDMFLFPPYMSTQAWTLCERIWSFWSKRSWRWICLWYSLTDYTVCLTFFYIFVAFNPATDDPTHQWCDPLICSRWTSCWFWIWSLFFGFRSSCGVPTTLSPLFRPEVSLKGAERLVKAWNWSCPGPRSKLNTRFEYRSSQLTIQPGFLGGKNESATAHAGEGQAAWMWDSMA